MGMTYKFPYKESPYIVVPAMWVFSEEKERKEKKRKRL